VLCWPALDTFAPALDTFFLIYVHLSTELCEMCDDGNLEGNDGCSSDCKFEEAYKCREGCSGPLCELEDDCDESLIGNKLQVRIFCRNAYNDLPPSPATL
jgi:cysteine-rich repeat protein